MCLLHAGGIGFIAFDSQRLGEFVLIDPRGRTVDALALLLVEQGVIPAEVIERCELSISDTDSGNIEVVLSARRADDEADQVFCHDAIKSMVDYINDPGEGTILPEVLQFASSAVAAPSLNADGGAPPTVVAMSSLLLLLVASLATLLL